MKLKLALMFLAILILLTACLGKQEKEIKTPNNDHLTLEVVKKAIEAEGIELSPKEGKSDWILNHVLPNIFSVNRPAEKEVNPELVYIYIFDSENARDDGLVDFNKQTEKYNMVIPLIFEKKNVLLLYWHHLDLNNGKTKTKFAEQIKNAYEHSLHLRLTP